MATNKSQFEIEVKTTADTAALDKTKDSLSEVGKAGHEAGEKQAEGAHHAELSHRELHEAVRAVGAQFGGLADVGLWLNPTTAGLAALLLLVDKVKEYLKGAEEAEEKVAASAEAIDASKMKALAEATQAAKDETIQLELAQQKLNAAYENGDRAIEARIAKLKAEQDAFMEIETAREAAFEAEIKRQVALGKITQDRAEAVIENAKLTLESERGATNEQKLQEEIDQRKTQLTAARQRLPGDQTELATARNAATAAAGRSAEASAAAEQGKGSFSSLYTDWKGSQSTFTGTMEELKKQIAAQREGVERNEEKGYGDLAERYKHDADALQDILDRQQAYVSNLDKIAAKEHEAAERAKGQVGIASERLTHDQELDRSGDDHIEQLQTQLDLLRRTNAEVERLHGQAGASTLAAESATRIASGRGSAAEVQAAQDQAQQDAASRTPQSEIYGHVTQLRQAAYDAHTAIGMGQGGDQDQLKQMLNETLGLIRDVHTSAAQRGQLMSVAAQFRQELDELKREVAQAHTQNSINRMNQGF